MKLELKHLAPYLPYRLRAISKNYCYDEIGLLKSLFYASKRSYVTCSLAFKSKNYIIKHNINSIKPILRPLSDLTKEIEINEEKFIPYNKLKTVVSNKQWLKICDIIDVDGGEYKKIVDMPYWWVNLLYTWHFDVFGLIEKGLAIDRNTLNK